MTAPLDIGLEQHDATLHYGQDDVFDLTHTTEGLRKKGGIKRLTDVMDEMAGSDDEDGAEDEDGDEDDEALDSEEERQRKVAQLEQEMDGLYDAYQERMKERDAKYKVKEARRKDKAREEWQGIREKDSDEEDEESDEEGGWDHVQQAKSRNDADSDTDMSDEEDEEVPQPSKKRRRGQEPSAPAKSSKRPRVEGTTNGAAKGAPQLSRAAETWFSQDFFSGAGISDIEDEDEDEESADEAEEEDEEMDYVSMDEPVSSAARYDVEFASHTLYYRLLQMTTMTSRSWRKNPRTTLTCGMWRMRTKTRSSRRRYEVSSINSPYSYSC